jgi:hypothetical protein
MKDDPAGSIRQYFDNVSDNGSEDQVLGSLAQCHVLYEVQYAHAFCRLHMSFSIRLATSACLHPYQIETSCQFSDLKRDHAFFTAQ